METTQIMVPGILVALKTRVYGGVHYQKQDLDEEEDGTVKRWETIRTMEDPAEHKAAGEVAGKASSMVARLCVRTSFGLLCRSEREAELDGAVREMRRLCTEWNQQARHSFIGVTAIKGRIADDDEEAIRAILAEAQELLDRMDKGLSEADVKMVRDAAQRAKNLSEMMTEDTSDQITAAVAAARQAARAIVKRGEAIGDKVANAIVETERESFAKARFSFLDTMAATVESLPSVNVQRTADLELEEATA